jgi:hypothetical protein
VSCQRGSPITESNLSFHVPAQVVTDLDTDALTSLAARVAPESGDLCGRLYRERGWPPTASADEQQSYSCMIVLLSVCGLCDYEVLTEEIRAD